MKKSRSASIPVMLALFAVLLISLGYLSFQESGREGLTCVGTKKLVPKTDTAPEHCA